MPFQQGEVISYIAMCQEEGVSLQRGMNFHLGPGHSVVLMSRRPNAPYVDRVEEGGAVIIYEGHDAPRALGEGDPKTVDQPMRTASGRLTQNGLFFEAAPARSELVRVYEKLIQGTWVYNGAFLLSAAWTETSNGRLVFKFRLDVTQEEQVAVQRQEREPSRVIPSSVKREVCSLCRNWHNILIGLFIGRDGEREGDLILTVDRRFFQ